MILLMYFTTTPARDGTDRRAVAAWDTELQSFTAIHRYQDVDHDAARDALLKREKLHKIAPVHPGPHLMIPAKQLYLLTDMLSTTRSKVNREKAKATWDSGG